MDLSSDNDLRKIYKSPNERALKKNIGRIEKHGKRFIQRSPFCIISTYDAKGHIDVSPRGGNPGFIKVVNEYCLLLPDARGNNRLDSLTNLTQTARIGMLFMIPGLDETLRISGSASITTESEKMAFFKEDPFNYLSVMEIRVEEAFLHCAKAFMRSKLWDVSSQVEPMEFPSIGEMLKDQLNLETPAETRTENKRRYKDEL